MCAHLDGSRHLSSSMEGASQASAEPQSGPGRREGALGRQAGVPLSLTTGPSVLGLPPVALVTQVWARGRGGA